MAIGLSMKGKKWRKVTKISNEASMSSLFVEGEKPVHYREGFKRDKLPAPWDDVYLVIMKYLTLEGRFGVYYDYHFPLLNHCRIRNFISIPFFLLHSLEDIVSDAREKKNKGLNFTIIHQGLIFFLYQFHLALCPPGVVVVDNQCHGKIHPQVPVLVPEFTPCNPPLAMKIRKRRNLMWLWNKRVVKRSK